MGKKKNKFQGKFCCCNLFVKSSVCTKDDYSFRSVKKNKSEHKDENPLSKSFTLGSL